VWARLASVGFVVAALGMYLDDLVPGPLSMPLASLVVDERLPHSDVLPLEPGSFAARNLLLVTIDTARPDRLGLYGNSEIATPNLDRFAARGSVFTRALAATPITLPSHASILTGLYPHRHGVRGNALTPLQLEHTTLAEVLSEYGYDTAAFVSSFVLAQQFGLAQGFDRYDDETHEDAATLGYAERRAGATTDRALSWLRNSRDQPYFLWVHYYDPHASYRPPPEFEASSENAYDGELAYIDQQVGRLLEGVSAASEAGALVIVTSDHGEAFGEHGEQSHGFLVQEATLRIPLMIGTTGGISTPSQIRDLVSHVDLMPTALSLLGFRQPTGLDGFDLTRAAPPDRVVLAETHYGQISYGWARLAAIYQRGLKYVDGPNPGLYDLATDPREQHNLIGERRADAQRLRERLLRARGPAADRLAVSNGLDRQSAERLEALGYLVPRDGAHERGGNGLDPGQMVPRLTEMLTLSTGLEAENDVPAWAHPILVALGRAPPRDEPELLAALEGFAQAHPDFAPVHRLLAELYQRSGRAESAAMSRFRFDELAGSHSAAPLANP
jgi:arylsulfatase A-like enzyme